MEVGFAKVESDKVGVDQLLILREGVDDFAVYVLNLNHLVIFLLVQRYAFFRIEAIIFIKWLCDRCYRGDRFDRGG